MADFFGTNGNDNLVGTSGEDRLVGSQGNDTLNGAGNGPDEFDLADYNGQSTGGAISSGLIINNTSQTRGGVAAYTVDKGPAGMDTLIGIESIHGSDFNDTIHIDGIVGQNDQVWVSDGAGDDVVIGYDASGNTSGLDIQVGSGNDTYTGIGINNNDRLRTDDRGNDAAGAIFQGVTVNFTGDKQGTLIDGWGGNDTFTGFGRVDGTHLNDVMNGNVGDDRFRGRQGNDSLSGGDGDDSFDGGEGTDTMHGGNGWDYVNYFEDFQDGGTGGIQIDLAAGTAVDGWGNAEVVTGMESVSTGMADDTINGDSNDNWFEGYAGADAINGGGGWDTANYDNDSRAGGTQGILADLGAGTIVDGFGDTDTVSGIEQVNGTDSADNMTAAGVSHDVRLRGRDGDDTLTGGDGHDGLDGGSGNDVLNGGAGHDFLEGRDGADTIDGGADWDTLAYDWDDQNPGNGVTVNWAAGTGADGTVQDWSGSTDTFTSIELIRGTFYDDTFNGNDGDNEFNGFAGNDVFDGSGGWDTVNFWRSGNDQFNPTQGAIIDLDDGTGVGGQIRGTATDIYGDTDTLIDIEAAVGSDLDDQITGSDHDNYLDGNNGNDVLNGLDGDDNIRGGDGDDVIDGGAGFDQAQYNGNISDFTLTDNGDGTYTMTDNTGQEGTDTLSNIERFWFNGSQTGVSLQAMLAGATSGNDVLDGSGSATGVDLAGLDGNDTLIGSAFDDTLQGNSGNDVITGGDGRDDIYGGDGNDVIDAVDPSGPNFDYIEPGAGSDTITGDGDDGIYYQNLGRNDTSGTDWSVTVDLAAGTAVSNSNGAVNDTFTGISSVGGTDYDDALLGSNNGWRFDTNGNEWFEGKGGSDVINGRGGWDTASYNWDGGNAGIQVDLAGNTIVDTHGNTDTVHGIEAVQGTDQVDTFVGDAGENHFKGLQGDDVMDGGAGRDAADYSEDERRGASQGITANLITGVIVDGFGDTDSVTSIEWVRGTDLGDTMVASDNGGDILEGRGGDDTLTGGAGADILWAGSGNDQLVGGGGNDLFGGLAGSDNVVDGGAGIDTARLDGDLSDFTFVQTAGGWDVTDNRDGTVNQLTSVEVFELNDGTVTEAQMLQGTGAGDDVVDQSGAASGVQIDLGAGNDMATGSDFADAISAGFGDDQVAAGAGDDVVTSAGGHSAMSGGDGNDVVSTLNGNNALAGDAGDDFVMGGIGNDDLSGGDGNDVIMGDVAGGFGGSDRINGGTGDDLMMGGVGSDVFVFGVNDGNDQIGALVVDPANPAGNTTISGGDFQAGFDTIELVGLGYADGAEALTHVSDVNGVAVFDDAANGLTITLHGVVTADLSASDFNIV